MPTALCVDFEIGRGENILFRFDRIRRTPSSVDAHRLVRYAARFGQADAMVEALFSAHFTDGLGYRQSRRAGGDRRGVRPGRAARTTFLVGGEEGGCGARR